MKTNLMLGAVLSALLLPALANETQPDKAAVTADNGATAALATQQKVQAMTAGELLALQREGERSTAKAQYLNGDAQQRVYQRYLQMFEHRVPEWFIDTDFGNR